VAGGALLCAAENTSRVNFDTSETLFGLMVAINHCGFDQDLAAAEPLRAKIRGEVAEAIQASEEAAAAATEMCGFYREHQTGDTGKDLAQYVSLALFLNADFTPRIKEAELPPDASYVLGILPQFKKVYEKARLHSIWLKHREQYGALIEKYHQPVAKMLFDTDISLKLPLSGYTGTGFTVYLEPMGASGQTNARNYGSDYFVVITPSSSTLKIEQIRHTYLHFVLDPLAMKHGTGLKRIEPLLDTVKTAPMDESFKSDISLLVTECLIRAIEARGAAASKHDEAQEREAVQNSVNEGFVLTHYFYDELIKLEKGPSSIRNTYTDLLYGIDLPREIKRSEQTVFSSQASPELVTGKRPRLGPQPLLKLAEQKLGIGEVSEAQKLAQQALDEKKEDPGRALFVLARAASMSREIDSARDYFERTLQTTHEAKLLAWSHIYLGRIFDLKEQRESAVEHYRAALDAGDASPEVKAAAERGLKEAYAPPESSEDKQQ
jgi:tetratricopeptide (TPR) repeat protein